MVRVPPGPGYHREHTFRGWPDATIAHPTEDQLEHVQRDRFMRSLQNRILHHLQLGQAVRLRHIGDFWKRRNTRLFLPDWGLGVPIPTRWEWQVRFRWAGASLRRRAVSYITNPTIEQAILEETRLPRWQIIAAMNNLTAWFEAMSKSNGFATGLPTKLRWHYFGTFYMARQQYTRKWDPVLLKWIIGPQLYTIRFRAHESLLNIINGYSTHKP